DLQPRTGFSCRHGVPEGTSDFWDLLRSCLVHVAVPVGSSWSARSRAAARTNELDAAQRRRIIASGEDRCPCWFLRVVVLFPAWLAEWSRKHPSGAASVRRLP